MFAYKEKRLANTLKRFAYVHKKPTANRYDKLSRQIPTANSHGKFTLEVILIFSSGAEVDVI